MIVNSWSILDTGHAEILNADPAAGDPANYGARFDSDGKRYGIEYVSLDATAVRVNGTSHLPNGRMYYVTSLPSPVFFINGIAHNEDGAMYVSTSDPQDYIAGKGARYDGALCVSIT